jgi:PTH1 family peptidyl-tRNA hydrolase
VHDDLDNALGKCKVKEGGSPEGHNGLKSIIEHIGSKDFRRLKYGISRPASHDSAEVARYVLGNFS